MFEETFFMIVAIEVGRVSEFNKLLTKSACSNESAFSANVLVPNKAYKEFPHSTFNLPPLTWKLQ